MTPGPRAWAPQALQAIVFDFDGVIADSERLQKWLESLDSDDLGKYKM